jgi:type IV pilus assembly protein PilA
VKTATRIARGYTLLELAVTVALVGVLAMLASQALDGASSRSKRRQAQAILKSLDAALDTYFTESGEYPADLTTLGFAFMGAKRTSANTMTIGSYTLIYKRGTESNDFYAATTANLDRDAWYDVVALNPGNEPHQLYDDINDSHWAMPAAKLPTFDTPDTGAGSGDGASGGGDTGGGDTGGGKGSGGSSGGRGSGN